MEDVKESCSPLLPSGAWSKGMMAIPGETAFREVASCGAGEYGDIPIDAATTQFVNQAYPGQDSDGSQAKPWKTIQEGVDAAAPGATVAVAAGSYPEDIVIDTKRVILWGRCPSMVEVVGLGAQQGAVDVHNKAADEAEIHSLAIRGAGAGINVSGASSVAIVRVWIHDTAYRGLSADDAYGPTRILLKGALIEGASGAGVVVRGAEATLEGVVVRDTHVDAGGRGGWGILATLGDQTMTRARVTVHASVIEQNREAGVSITGSDATLESVVVRDTLPAGTTEAGAGIYVINDPAAMQRAKVTVRASIVERSRGFGVAVTGSDATLTGVVVRDSLPNAEGQQGWGINLQHALGSQEPTNATLRGVLVEGSHESGIAITDSNATIAGASVRSTLPGGDGLLGDGIEIVANDGLATVAIMGSEVASSARAGIASWGATVALTESVVSCNAFDLEDEVLNGHRSSWSGSKGNLCGCGELTERCRVSSVYLPPPPLEPPPAPSPAGS